MTAPGAAAGAFGDNFTRIGHKSFIGVKRSKGTTSRRPRSVSIVPELEIFADPSSVSVCAWVVLLSIAAQIEIAAFITRRMPRRLPASIVRRAL